MAFSLTLNLIFFALIRFLVGICLGIILSMTLNLCAECLPVKNRALVILCICTAFSIGSILCSITMLFTMPELESSGLFSTILYLSIIPAIAIIISILFLEDSPRNLILKNKDEEAFKIIEKINGKSLDKSAKESVLRSVIESGNKEVLSQMTEIFNSRFIYLTVIISFISLINAINTHGPGLISVYTLKYLGLESKSSNHQIIIDQIIMSLIGLPSQLIAGILCEIKFLGRKNCSLLILFLAFVCTVIFIFFPKTYIVLFSLSQSLLGMLVNLILAYICEVYPTKIRDYATGYFFSVNRFGGLISMFIYISLNSLGTWIPYYVYVGLILLNICFIFSLPYETYGQVLDHDYEKK